MVAVFSSVNSDMTREDWIISLMNEVNFGFSFQQFNIFQIQILFVKMWLFDKVNKDCTLYIQ